MEGFSDAYTRVLTYDERKQLSNKFFDDILNVIDKFILILFDNM
jgi:hypothetical protein